MLHNHQGHKSLIITKTVLGQCMHELVLKVCNSCCIILSFDAGSFGFRHPKIYVRAQNKLTDYWLCRVSAYQVYLPLKMFTSVLPSQ